MKTYLASMSSKLILCVGRTEGSQAIPEKLQELLLPGRIYSVCCSGDCSSLDFLQTLSSDLNVVQGSRDPSGSHRDEIVISSCGDTKIALLHGSQIVPLNDTRSLVSHAIKSSADVVVVGSASRMPSYEMTVEGVLVIRTGSINTGFILIDVGDSSKYVIYSYHLKGASNGGGEVVIDRQDLQKQAAS